MKEYNTNMTNFIFVTGGVVSGIGKGIVAASIANLLTRLNYSVSVLKCDPYINIDPGTMNPREHGEVFVTYDGGETDLDLGHYERFIGKPLTKLSSITTGTIYNSVISKERAGKYNGSTVQIFHITNEIKSKIYNLASTTSCDYLVIEIGGTIGDLESLPFIEAVRQIQTELEPTESCSVHCSYVPYLSCSGEYKTKPTQHSVKELRGLGVTPDIIITRPEGGSLSNSILNKIAEFCYVKRENVIDCPNMNSLYQVPYVLQSNGILDCLKAKFGFKSYKVDNAWNFMTYKLEGTYHLKHKATIALIGKYMDQKDSYISVVEALKHAAIQTSTWLDIKFIDSTKRHDNFRLSNVDGVIVPGGFGTSGVENIISFLHYCRTHKIPTLGICLGMQLMCIEYAREFISSESTTRELSEDPDEINIIDYLPDQYDNIDLGGTLRLGTYPTSIQPYTLAGRAYNDSIVYERHRHRYELNNIYRGPLVNAGLITSGVSPDSRLVEIVELDTNLHPWYLGTQFHPEFQSYPLDPHPLFLNFINTVNLCQK